MTNLTHLSSAHRDQCPRRRWDTRLMPPAHHLLAEKRQNGAMSRWQMSSYWRGTVTRIQPKNMVTLLPWSANSAKMRLIVMLVQTVLVGSGPLKMLWDLTALFLSLWSYFIKTFLAFFLSSWLRFCSGWFFLEDCIIKGKWLRNKCLPSFWNRWKFKLLWALISTFFFWSIWILFVYLWVCSEVKKGLTARFAHQHKAVLPGNAAAAFQTHREKNRHLYRGTAKDKGHDASVNSVALHALHRPSRECYDRLHSEDNQSPQNFFSFRPSISIVNHSQSSPKLEDAK